MTRNEGDVLNDAHGATGAHMQESSDSKRQESSGSEGSFSAEQMTDRKLSLADIERRRSKPLGWVFFIIGLLIAIVAPYGVGRFLAVRHTGMLVRYLDVFEPRGIALIAWVAAFLAIVSIAMCIIEARSWTWRILLLVTVSAEQFIAGLCLLKMSFWYSTYVVFGDKAYLANAANLGIIAAGLGAAVFAVLFVAILVLVKKDSPLNILTRSWVALSVFTVIEVLALLIVLFGGLLTVV
ncbi:hypothetical protein [Bifidobacterium crudilactis]|jgi:hypothetical protein|uniref:hypothetical protein n=1 Tax=Bifidobacterium crudilactis TaxID=327277 RepID=UPI003A5C2D5C